MAPPRGRGDDDPPKDLSWRQLSLEQLSAKVDGQHARMGGYIDGLKDAQERATRAIVAELSATYLSRRDLEYELEVMEERYGWIPTLLKWVGIAFGGAVIAALLKGILK